MFQVESSMVCQYVNILIRSVKIELVPSVTRKWNTELNCQYANIQTRASKIVIDRFYKGELKNRKERNILLIFLPEYILCAGFFPLFINGKTCGGQRIRSNRSRNQICLASFTIGLPK